MASPSSAVPVSPMGIAALSGGGAAASTNPSTTPASSPGALPSLTPADSPYQPLDLPQVAAPTVHPLPQQQPTQNLGAVNRAGAFAYIANQVLRGAVQGYDAGRIQHAQQFNKKLSALSNLQNQLGQQYVEAYNDVGSSRPGMTPQEILADPKVKQLHNQLLAVHQTTQEAIQSYLPATGAGTGSKSSKGTKQQQQKKNLMERLFGQDSNEALQAYSEVAHQLGPTAFYQVASPQQLNALYQQRQNAATQTELSSASEQNKLTLEKAISEYADAVKSGDQDKMAQALSRVDAIKSAESPERSPKYVNITDGAGHIQTIDETREGIPSGWHLTGTSAGSIPKVGSFGDFMSAAYGPHPTPQQYLEGRKLWAQATASSTEGYRTVMVQQGNQLVPFQFWYGSHKNYPGAAAPNARMDQEVGVGSSNPSTPTQVTPKSSAASEPTPASTLAPTRAPNSAVSKKPSYSTSASTAPGYSTHAPTQQGAPIGYKFSPETSDLLKKAADANSAYQGLQGFYKEALQNAKEIKNNPTNGIAKMNLVSIFLKSIGAHSTAISGSQVRLTQSEWNMVMKSAPVVDRMLSKFAQTHDGMTYLSGVTLTPDQISNIVRAIGDKTLSMKSTWQGIQKEAAKSAATDKAGMSGGGNGAKRGSASASSSSSAPSSPAPATASDSGSFNFDDYPTQ